MSEKKLEIDEFLWSAVHKAVMVRKGVAGEELSAATYIRKAIEVELEHAGVRPGREEPPLWEDHFIWEEAESGPEIAHGLGGSWAGVHKAIRRETVVTGRAMGTSAWVHKAVKKQLARDGIKVGTEEDPTPRH